MPDMDFLEPKERFGVRTRTGILAKTPVQQPSDESRLPEVLTDDELALHAAVSRQYCDNGRLPVSQTDMLGQINDGRPPEMGWDQERLEKTIKMLLRRRILKERGYRTYTL